MVGRQLRWLLMGLLGLVGAVFILLSVAGPAMLSHQSDKLINLKLQSKTLDSELSSLAVARKQVATYGFFNGVAQTVIPSDKDQAAAVLDISQSAAQSGIALASITFPTSTLGVGTGTQSATATTPSNAISQAKPVSGIDGLYSLELTVTPQTGNSVPASQQATYTKLLNFLDRVERDRRTAQITGLSIQPQSSNGTPSSNINFTLTINIFMKP